MAIEIERKFLVISDEWKQHVATVEELAQGYLAASPTALVRVRASRTRGWITIKGQQLGETTDVLKRVEYEYVIPVDDARDIIADLAQSAVTKTRYTLDYAPHQWTVDVFHGDNDGLVLLEIEGDTVGELDAQSLPEWVGADVSDDSRMSNAYLSHSPYTTWCDDN